MFRRRKEKIKTEELNEIKKMEELIKQIELKELINKKESEKLVAIDFIITDTKTHEVVIVWNDKTITNHLPKGKEPKDIKTNFALAFVEKLIGNNEELEKYIQERILEKGA